MYEWGETRRAFVFQSLVTNQDEHETLGYWGHAEWIELSQSRIFGCLLNGLV